MGLTLQQLIESFLSDPDSSFHRLSYQVRVKQTRTLTRVGEKHGSHQLRTIKARTLLNWHRAWGAGGKIAMAGEFIARLRPLFRFGFLMLEDRECLRLLQLLGGMRFQSLGARFVPLTVEHVRAIRVAAHDFAYPSIALAQVLQFELGISQKDVIGEWLPISEPGESNYVSRGKKWLRGLQWSNIDDNLILRHVTGSSGRPIEADLSTAPMIMEEFGLIFSRSSTGPIIICETTGMPWATTEFRRKWRKIAKAAGIPDTIKNRDSVPAGMIAGDGPDRANVSQVITLARLDFTSRTKRR